MCNSLILNKKKRFTFLFYLNILLYLHIVKWNLDHVFVLFNLVMNQERTLTFGKYKGTHRSNITGGFSAGDFGGLIYSIENFNESEHEF